MPEFKREPQDSGDATTRDEEKRIAIAMANLKASRPDLSIEEARRLATAAVRNSTPLEDGSSLVLPRSAELTTTQASAAGVESVGTVIPISPERQAILDQIAQQQAKLAAESANPSYSDNARAFITAGILEVIRQLQAQLPAA